MAACWADGGGASGDADRDAARQGGIEGDDGEDRPKRRARHGTADAHGVVPAGALIRRAVMPHIGSSDEAVVRGITGVVVDKGYLVTRLDTLVNWARTG